MLMNINNTKLMVNNGLCSHACILLFLFYFILSSLTSSWHSRKICWVLPLLNLCPLNWVFTGEDCVSHLVLGKWEYAVFELILSLCV